MYHVCKPEDKLFDNLFETEYKSKLLNHKLFTYHLLSA